MTRRIFLNTVCLVSVVAAVFLISAYKNPAGKLYAGRHVRHGGERNLSTQDLEILRKRIVDDLLAPAINVSEVKRIVQTIKPDGSWPGINYKDTTKTGFEHRIHLENMLELARAYKKPGSEFYMN